MATTMERVVPTSRWNKILLFMSLACASFCLIIERCAGLTSLPIYVPILWAVVVTVVSTWLSFFLLKKTLNASAPFYMNGVTPWIQNTLESYLGLTSSGKTAGEKVDRCAEGEVEGDKKISDIKEKRESPGNISEPPRSIDLDKILDEIDTKLIGVWYNDLSEDEAFRNEARDLLRILLKKMFEEIRTIDETRLARKIADVFLLHLKEYRRALRRVEKGTAVDVEEAYRCTHPGARSSSTIEHTLHRLVAVLAGEFLQWELTSSLPCKLLLSVLAKRLLFMVQIVGCPRWIFDNCIALLGFEAETKKEECSSEAVEKNSIVSKALGKGIGSATAAVVPRPLPISTAEEKPIAAKKISGNEDTKSVSNSRKASLSLDGLAPIGHRGLWADVNVSQVDDEGDEDRISPIYEEPTDFATTIARLRNLLQQKSTATTPLQAEEKSYVVYEGNQFTNLAIPWTEFYTAADGSQQLLYCIQFDDIEQHGVDTFETTTATVRRQYTDFATLHANLEEVPSFSSIMSEIHLPEGGGRTDMENYLRTVCTRLSADSPPQLRHFLRPSSGAGKKADAVAPRLDRFLAKTVTGVFNTLRTVVPGFEMEQEEEIQPLPTLMPLADIPWRFVENTKAKSLAFELQQLVAERIDYCSVDTAYEAVDSVEGNGDSEMLAMWWETVNATYDEELEELDCRLSMTCASIDLLCEILAGIRSNNTIQQEAVVRWSKLFFGSITEPLIQTLVSRVSLHPSDIVFSPNLQIDDPDEPIDNVKKKLSRLLEAKVANEIKRIFGEDDVRDIINFLLSSFEHRKINLDLSLQIIDILASELLASCRLSHANATP